MSTTAPTASQEFLDRIYGRIAGRYDAVNTLQSFGLDRPARRAAARGLRGRVLDLGAGSGDLAAACLEAGADRVVCLDRSAGMFDVARRKLARAESARRVVFVFGDAARLPFRDGVFDGVGSAFLFRNLPTAGEAVAEMARVMRPGARAAVVDVFAPPPGVWGWLYRWYLKTAVPWWGRLVTGDAAAYRYLSASIRRCFGARDFAARLARAGLADVRVRDKVGGIMAVVTARKP